MKDPTKPQRPVLTLKGKGTKPAQKAAAGHGGKGHGKGGKPQKPPQPPEPGQQCRLCGAHRRLKGPPPAPTPPRSPAPYVARFWMVMRSTGRRPKARHATLGAAQEEATRIAGLYAAGGRVEVWVIECTTVATIAASGAPGPAGVSHA